MEPVDPSVVEDYYQFRKNFNIGIELEVAYKPEIREGKRFECFLEDDDSTITSDAPTAEMGEFILKTKFMKYFQHKEKIDKEISDIVSFSYNNDGSCGTHVHMSHPSITKTQNPDFLMYLDYYWVYYSQEKIKMKYPQVRNGNEFAEDNKGWLLGDKDNRYIQMNIQPTLDGPDDLVHVEFRGYDGMPNSTSPTGSGKPTFWTQIEMKMISFYIEDLCDEFAQAYFSFKQGIPCIPIETLNEITAKEVYEIMEMYALDVKPQWDSEYQLECMRRLMHYTRLDTSKDILSAYEYYDYEKGRTITHDQPLIIKLLSYFTMWCEEPMKVRQFLELVPEEVWAKNGNKIEQVITTNTGYTKPGYSDVVNFVDKRNNVSLKPRRRRAKSKGREKAAAPPPPPYRPVSPDYSPYSPHTQRPVSPDYSPHTQRPMSPDYSPTVPSGDADSGSASSSASSSTPPAPRGRSRARSRGRTRRLVDGGDPLRDLRLRF